MRNQLIFILPLALVLLACDPESDYSDLTPLDPAKAINVITGDEAVTEGSESQVISRTSCMEISTTQWFKGFRSHQPLQKYTESESDMIAIPSKLITIKAKGDAISTEYARGISDLNLILTNSPNRITGNLVTHFYYGEIMELKIDGEVNVECKEKVMYLTTSVKEAKFIINGKAELGLASGEIVFILPLNPEGTFDLEVNTNTLFCPE
jgi:hypothetical protein